MESYGDSKLIINQVRGEYEVRNKNSVPYYQVTVVWVEKFKCYINYVPRKDNTHANALSSLATTLSLPSKVEQKVFKASWTLYHPKQAPEINNDAKQSQKNKIVYEVSTSMEPREWQLSFTGFMLYSILPDNSKEATSIKKEDGMMLL